MILNLKVYTYRLKTLFAVIINVGNFAIINV